MADIPPSNTEAGTSEARWHRWEQRGRQNDERLLRRARITLVVAVLAALGGIVSLRLPG
jgi:hypothetical protein